MGARPDMGCVFAERCVGEIIWPVHHVCEGKRPETSQRGQVQLIRMKETQYVAGFPRPKDLYCIDSDSARACRQRGQVELPATLPPPKLDHVGSMVAPELRDEFPAKNIARLDLLAVAACTQNSWRIRS